MTEAFRFMGANRVSSFMSGSSIAMGRLNYYRLMEAAQGDMRIGDRQEAIQRAHLATSPSDPNHERVMAWLAPNIQGMTGRLQIAPSIVTRLPDAYILSLSLGPLGQLMEAVENGDFGFSPVEACVRICDAEELAWRLWKNGILPNGEKVSECFDPPIVGQVTYDGGDEIGAIEDFPNGSSTAFVKRSFYRPQREWRIFMQHHSEIPNSLDRVIITCPEVAELLELEFCSQPSSSEILQPRIYWFERLYSLYEQDSTDRNEIALAYVGYRGAIMNDLGQIEIDSVREVDRLIVTGLVSGRMLNRVIARSMLRNDPIWKDKKLPP